MLYQPEWRGHWIKAPDAQAHYHAYFRKTFQVNSGVVNAWLQMAADNEFILKVNGRLIGSDYLHLSSNLYSLRSRLEESGQQAGHDLEYRLGANPDMQWTPQREWVIGTLYDITPYLKVGTNLITVLVQTNSAHPRLIIDGAVELENGISLSLATDTTWRANTIGEVKAGLEWDELSFPDDHWESAVIDSDDSLGMPSTTVDPAAFQIKPQGQWMSGASSSTEDLFLRHSILLGNTPEDGWIRVYANYSYDVFVNGHRLNMGGGLIRGRWQDVIRIMDIKSLLQRGENVIAISVHAPLQQPGYSERARVFLDALIRLPEGEIRIDSGPGWRVTNAAPAGWITPGFNDSEWRSPELLPLPKASTTSIGKRKKFFGFEIAYAQLWQQNLLITAAIFVILAIGTIFATSSGLRHLHPDPNVITRFVMLSLVPAFALAGIALLLRHRFAVDETKLWLAQPGIWQAVFILLLALVGTGLMACWSKLRAFPGVGDKLSEGSYSTNKSPQRRSLANFLHYASLAAVIAAGAYLRLRDLGFEWLQNDEFVSVSAARGILESNAPTYPSGVWYTRSPFYHYLLAAFIAWFGDTSEAVRLPSAILGIMLLVLMYSVARDISGRRTVALLVVGFLAISPWEIFMARSARFYTLMQFFAVAAIYYFIKGFIREHVPKYQICFFIFYTLAFLSQEVVIILVPAFFVGYLLFAKPFNWRDSKVLSSGLVTFFFIVAIDGITFNTLCLTNLAGISPVTGSIISPHLVDLFGYILDLFVGQGRANVLLTVLFFAALPIWFYRQDKVFVFLFLVIVLTLLAATSLIMQVRPRYIFALYPIFILMALSGLFELLCSKQKVAENDITGASFQSMGRLVGTFAIVITVGALIWSQQPVRLWESYSQHINAGDMEATRFVSSHRKPGDLLITAHPQAGLYFSQKVDYYLMGWVAFDEIFRKNGVMIDRWWGGELIDSVDKLRYVLERAERAWIVIGELRFTRQLDNDTKEFLKKNLRLVYQPFNSNVYLWEKPKGMIFIPEHYQRERNLF
jgi:hypothetical protein